MERMHEIMKKRLEADEALSSFKDTHRSLIESLNKEMSIRGPIKIGDIVEVTGYSCRGKKMVVDRLWISNDQSWLRGRYGVKAKGRVLKKDGTPGLRIAYYFIEVGCAP